MAKAEARIWHFGLTVGYWQAHRFISVYGSPLFGAVSNSKSNTTIDRPHMAFAHLEYAQSLGRGFSWGVQIDADQHWQRGIHNRTENVYTTPLFDHRLCSRHLPTHDTKLLNQKVRSKVINLR